MISLRSVDRGFPETILLIPGWAMDHRIFDSLELDFNYLIPAKFVFKSFADDILSQLNKVNLKKISILGSSMGGFLAANFAAKYPDRVKDITLIGMRQHYDKDGIDKVKGLLSAGKEAYLYSFYRNCFSATEKKSYVLFKTMIMRDYMEGLDTEDLLAELDYLAEAELCTDKLKEVQIRFMHGECDKIAPLEGILKLKEMLPAAGFTVLSGAGHMPFLANNFTELFYGR